VSASRQGATLAIDLGGTRLKAGVVVGQTVVRQLVAPTGDEQGFDHVLRNLCAVGDELTRATPVEAIGVGVPAIVDPETGRVVDVRKNLLGLIGFPLAETLRARYDVPVTVENDARLYGLGEIVAGAAQGAKNAVCLTFGTGVGCCVLLDGRILRGRRGVGGILGGHITLQADGSLCTCGNYGCYEVLCRASALVEHARLTVADPDGASDDQYPTAEAVLAAAAAGDRAAQAALATYLRHLAAGVVSYVNLFDPDVVVLGGGLFNAAAQILEPIVEEVQARAWGMAGHEISIRAAALGDQAALIGGAALASGYDAFW